MKKEAEMDWLIRGHEAFFTSRLGAGFLGDSTDLLKEIPDESIDLVLTSPPYALHFKKEYGNVNQDKYVNWLLSFAPEIKRILKPKGSFVLNVGGSWTPGKPTRALCHLEIAIRMVREQEFYLAQEFFWHNPAKLPSPAEWVNVRKIRVKDSIEYVWWFSKDPFPKANNQEVLQPYSPDMIRLLHRGYRAKVRPSGHNITAKFVDKGGSIPGNMLSFGNNDANSRYFVRCEETGIKPHPARFPPQLPAFFLRFLTDPNDLVLDPFAGSCTTGEVAENLGRRWICFDLEKDYLESAKFRFEVPWDEERRSHIIGSGSKNVSIDPDAPEQVAFTFK
jgi:DNA modification methylase